MTNRNQLPTGDRMEALFWARVQKGEGCWEWVGGLTQPGYGHFNQGRRGVWQLAHRYSWELHNGPIPAGMLVCHRCDNRRCVRPDHLFLGTHRDNLRDMAQKGRQGFQVHPEKASRGDSHWTRKNPERLPRGEAANRAKLTADAVRDIRARHAAGESLSALGRAFGVSHVSIRYVVTRRSWAHID